MPVIALVLFAVFAALGFGWRSWEQHRRAGSTGFRGISGRLGSAEWFAGIGFVVALVAALAAPLLQLSGVVSPLGLLAASWIQAGGIALARARHRGDRLCPGRHGRLVADRRGPR